MINDFLIVAFYAGSFVAKPSLVKIPVNDPQNFTGVELAFPATFPDLSFDGILLSRDGKELIGVNNKFFAVPIEVMHLTSNDHWGSAKLIQTFPTGFTSPTTATTDGKDIFVMYSFLLDVFFWNAVYKQHFRDQKNPFPEYKIILIQLLL